MTLIKHLKAVLKITNDEWDAADDAEDWERYDRLEGEVEAYEHCIKLLTDATTPRPPQAEWFGTGPGQWGDWYIAWVGHDNIERELLVRNAQYCDESMLPRITWDNPGDTIKGSLGFDVIIACKPIARKGCAPAGWQVLEVKP